MIKAVVTLNRKVTRDYNSSGYGVSIEGELAVTPDDHEGVLGRVKELFGLAEQALAQEIDRDQGEQALGRRDEEPSQPPSSRSRGNGIQTQTAPPRRNDQPNGDGPAGEDRITDKQVKFLFTLSKRHGLSNIQLDGEIERIVGRRSRVYDLTKKEAGRVIDALAQDTRTNSR